MQGSRPENIRDGEYVFSIDTCKAFVSRAGHDSVVIEFTVDEAIETADDGTRPNRVGSRVRSFYPLYRDRDNELTQDGERWMSRLKTFLANVLGGEEREVDGEPAPVTDDEVTPFIAASIIKGTEMGVGTMGDEKRAAVMFEVATKKTKDGGLGMPEDVANEAIESGQLNFADISGMKIRCHAKTVLSSKGKRFTNTYWAPCSE